MRYTDAHGFFFARLTDGYWQYLYKIYTPEQFAFTSRHYMMMRLGPINAEGKHSDDAPHKWQEVTYFQKLEIPVPPTDMDWLEPERTAIQHKLRELNASIPGAMENEKDWAYHNLKALFSLSKK